MRTVSKCALFLLVLTCSAQLHAQTAQRTSPINVLPAKVQSQAQYSGSVFGHVYCADTNAPARFARVTLTPVRSSDNDTNGSYWGSISTGLDGSFQIPNVRPGTYYVSASLPGYLDPLSQVAPSDLASTDPAAQQRVASIITPISVDGSEGAHAEVRLKRGASVSGTVYYDDGSPAVNVLVSAQPATESSTPAGSSRLAGVIFFNRTSNGQPPPRTDDYGRFRISGLQPGDYVIAASAIFTEAVAASGNRSYQSQAFSVYAPRSFRATDAKVFTLMAGNELDGVDIQIPLAAFHMVSGAAESSDGHALNAGNVTLSDDKDKTRSFRGSIDSSGQFHFLYVTAGSYTLTLTGGAITEQDTTSGRGRPHTTVLQSFGTGTQSVLVENGDLAGVVVQAPPLTQTTATPTP